MSEKKGKGHQEDIEILLNDDGDVPDTLTHIARISNEYAYQVLDDAIILESETDKKTAENIWYFVRENVS